MAFDAGAITASLTVDTSAFDRALDKARADVEKLERAGHKVKISAVFDSGSVGRARKMFADLDNSISRDAMNRLKSSPQGSVLGSLNALFSPHPVTGAPSPSQSAQGGLLGKMLSPEASGGGTGYSSSSGSPLASALAQTANVTDNVKSNLTGAQPGNVTTTDSIKQALIGQGAQNTTTTDDIRQALVGKGATNTTTTDDIKQALVGQGATNVTTTDTIKQALTGAGAKNTTTTDTVREKLDSASEATTEKAAASSGDRSGTSFMGMFTSHIKNLLPKSATDDLKGKAKSAGDDAGGVLDKGLLGGIGPGILGISTKLAGITGLVGSALGALPALMGVIGTGMGVAMVGGLLAVAIKGNAKLSAQFTDLGGDFETVIAKAFAPIVPLVSKAIGTLVPMIASLQGPLTSIFKTIGPQIGGIFAGLKPIIAGLLDLLKAAAPAFGPFVEAIENLVGSLLPGIATVVKATTPFIRNFADILGSLGGSLGSLFATAAPAIGASMKILGGLLALIGDLLPVVMKLADIFAVTLAPVFTALAGVVQTLIGPLTLIGTVIAQFAGAVIGDLAGAFGAVATLIQAIGPSLGVLAAAFGSLFTVLENAGVFALLGDALENLAPALGKLIALLITDLAPILPMIVDLFSQLLTITVALATSGLGVLISVLTTLISALPVGLVQALVGGFIGLKLVMLGFEGVSAIFAAVTAAVTALGAALDFDTIALQAMYLWDNLVTIATKAWEVAQIVLDAVLNLSPLGLIVIAIAAIGAAIYLLVANWSTVWGTIKSVAADVGDFLGNLFHNQIVQDILAVWSLGLIPLAEHWSTVWGDIETVAKGFWSWLSGIFGTDLSGFFTKTIPGWWNELVADAKMFATDAENAVRAIWTWLSTSFGPDLLRFFTVTIPGWLDDLVADARSFNADLLVPFRAIWTWLSGTFGADILRFFTVTIPGWFDRLIALTGSHFAAPFENVISGAWTWVTRNVFDKMEAFFTTTLPGWFDAAVSAIGRFWGGLEKTVSTPVRWVLSNVVDPLFGAIDDVTNFVGLGRPLPANLATGGRLAGYGGGDIVPALLEPGEAVVDKDRTRKYAGLLKMMGVPGFADGGKILAFGASTTAGYNAAAGYSYVDQLGSMLGGGFDLVNAGIAGNELTSSGGVGAAGDKRFASLLKGVKAALAWEGINDLAAGVSAGGVEGGLASLIKTAHAVGIPVVLGTLQPANFTGAKEKSRQSVNDWIRGGHGADAYADLDAILRSGPGSNHMASWAYAGATGANKGIHPGAAGYDGVARVFDRALAQVIGGFKPAGWRTNLSQFSGGGLVGSLFEAMGAPGFSTGGPVGGRGGALGAVNPTGGDVLGDIGSFFAGLVGKGLDLSKIGLDLAHGDSGGAERALMSLLGVSGSGGAAGAMGKVLLALPGTLATDAMKYLVDPVAKWVTGQQSAPVGSVGSGVKRWSSLVLQALKMEGLPAGDLSLVLRQITSESGGNPNAINNWDINAQNGDPSRGLLQTIMTTFQAYHWPGTSGDIYDPLANIAAALNYATHTVGIGPNPGQLGGGTGYALGGRINEPIIGFGVSSGRRYTFGENGPEYVTPGGSPPGSDPAMLARLDQLIAATRQIPAGVGNSVGGAISGSAHAASFRSRYPRGGA
jgi:SLT domain-containing protein/phage-related protein